jgi:cobalt-zinc-cadmium efflux system protein
MTNRYDDSANAYETTWNQCRLDVTYFFMTVVSGVLTNSLTLVADAAHWLVSAGALCVVLFGIWVRTNTGSDVSIGYRAFMTALVVHIALLLSIAFIVLYEAFHRFERAQSVADVPMLFLGAIGLAVKWNCRSRRIAGPQPPQLVSQWSFKSGVAIFGSIAVILAAVTIQFTGWNNIDSALGVVSALFVLPHAWALISDSASLLAGPTPADIDPLKVKHALLEIDDVAQVYDLRIRNCRSECNSVSAHLVLKSEALARGAFDVVERASAVMCNRFKIAHSTFHIERDSDDALENDTWTSEDG